MPTEQNTSMTYMDHLRTIALAGVALIVEKTRTYGPSWKRRGGAGAWFTTVRPWDRLEKIVDEHNGDIFAAIAASPEGADGSALACVRDMRNYLLLIEAEMVARGVVAVEAGPGYVDQDTSPPAAPLGAGPIQDGCYTTLDLGQSREPWHVGLTGLDPDAKAKDYISRHHLVSHLGALVASRELTDGDHQIIIRIPGPK